MTSFVPQVKAQLLKIHEGGGDFRDLFRDSGWPMREQGPAHPKYMEEHEREPAAQLFFGWFQGDSQQDSMRLVHVAVMCGCTFDVSRGRALDAVIGELLGPERAKVYVDAVAIADMIV